eukprot:GEMP01000812.1.p1 GENE.GEMP01000812.1~~GEMP01000812.1.p1  ORF type:complete len:1632 (+),score=469.22 GEMP01000812.1:457-5352(+)
MAFSRLLGMRKLRDRQLEHLLKIDHFEQGDFCEAWDAIGMEHTCFPTNKPFHEVLKGRALLLLNPVHQGERRAYVQDIKADVEGWIDLWVVNKEGEEVPKVRNVKRSEKAVKQYMEDVIAPSASHLSTMRNGARYMSTMMIELRQAYEDDSTVLVSAAVGEMLEILQAMENSAFVILLLRRKTVGWINFRTEGGLSLIRPLDKEHADHCNSPAALRKRMFQGAHCVVTTGPLDFIYYENDRAGREKMDKNAQLTFIRYVAEDDVIKATTSMGVTGWMKLTDSAGKLSVGMDVNAPVVTMLTAEEELLISAKGGDLETLQVVCETAGAVDVNCVDTEGRSALFYAVAHGHVLCARYLLKRQDVHTFAVDNFNRLPLHYAHCFPSKDMIELLVKKKAKVNHQDDFGRTALSYLATSEDIDAVSVLLDNDADVNLLCNVEWTSCDHAYAAKDLAMLSFLEKAGGVRSQAKATSSSDMASPDIEPWNAQCEPPLEVSLNGEFARLEKCLQAAHNEENAQVLPAIMNIARACDLDISESENLLEMMPERIKAAEYLNALVSKKNINGEELSAAISRYEDSGASRAQLSKYVDIHKKTTGKDFALRAKRRLTFKTNHTIAASTVPHLTARGRSHSIAVSEGQSMRNSNASNIEDIRLSFAAAATGWADDSDASPAPPPPSMRAMKTDDGVKVLTALAAAKPFVASHLAQAVDAYRKNGGSAAECTKFQKIVDTEQHRVQQAIQKAIGVEEKIEVLKGLVKQAKDANVDTSELEKYGEVLIVRQKAIAMIEGVCKQQKTPQFDHVLFQAALQALENSGLSPQKTKRYRDILEEEKKILKERLDTAIDAEDTASLVKLIPACRSCDINTDEAVKVAESAPIKQAAMDDLNTISMQMPVPLGAFKDALDSVEQLGVKPAEFARYRRMYNNERGNLENSMKEAIDKEDLKMLASLMAECRKCDIDVTGAQLLAEQLPKRNVARKNLERMMPKKDPFPLAEFKAELTIFQAQGGHGPSLETFTEKYDAENKVQRRKVLMDRLSTAKTPKALADAVLAAEESGMVEPDVVREYATLLKNLEPADTAEEKIKRELKLPVEKMQIDKINYWTKSLIFHGREKTKLVAEAQELLKKEGPPFYARQRLKECDNADPATGDAFLDALKAAIDNATNILGAAELAPYVAKYKEEERYLRVRQGMENARQYTADYMEVTNTDQLEAGRKAVTEAIVVAQQYGIPEEELSQLIIHRRRIHNRIEDLKGKIRIYTRIRPPIKTEAGKFEPVICVPEGEMNTTVLPDPDSDVKSDQVASQFAFDACFAPGEQEAIFADVADLLQSCLDGYRCAIFAYGQTGSGKTHTMYGTDQHPGITRRTGAHLFALMESLSNLYTFEVYGSIYEVYRKKIIDLIADLNIKGKEIAVGYDDAASKVTLEGVTERILTKPSDMHKLIEDGMKTRKVAATAMNAESSRSHLMLQLRVVNKRKGHNEKSEGKMVLIDLAGSERLKKSAVSSDAAEEAVEINVSLTALGDVIQACADRAKNIPYRNHVLTKLMRDAIGGSAKTLMFVNLSPSLENRDETIQSLRWASRAKNIGRSGSPQPSNPGSPRLRAGTKATRMNSPTPGAADGNESVCSLSPKTTPRRARRK